MELPQSYVQYRRGPCASAPKDTVAIKGGGTTPRKFDLTKERCREVENRERTALARSFSFEAQGLNGAQQQQQHSHDIRMGRKLWSRTSKARVSRTHPQLMCKTVAFGGRGEPTSGQSTQASFFPFLVGDDDRPDQYRERHVDNPDSNFDGITVRSIVRRVEAGPHHHASYAPISSGGALKETPATQSSSISCISKPVHDRKRGMGQPCRAHHALSLRCATEGSRMIGGGAEAFADPKSTGDVRQRGNDLSSDGKPVTSEPLVLSTVTSAMSMVDRAGVVLSTSPGYNPGDGCGASPHKHSELQQHPRSATSSRASSPRVSSPTSHTPVDSTFRDDDSARLENVSGRGAGASANLSKRRSYSVGRSRGFRQDDAAKSSSGTLTSSSTDDRSRGVIAGGFVEREDGRQEGTLLPGPEGGVEVRQMDGGILVVRRSGLEKRRSPEKLHLHGRQLKSCPLIQDDSGLRLLNFQNNLIGKITNLANLPNLIFLDLYNNRIDTLEVSLAATSGLRVIMAGKNRIDKISNLENLRKLDVLDLHSNAIRDMEGFDSLQELRVLNLAGNRVRIVENVSSLTALTELNLRRNMIEKVMELDGLPRLQRLFLSNNRIKSFSDCQCIFSVGSLLELSLDGNPVANHYSVGSHYQRFILQRLPSLLHLDLRRVRVNERDQPYPDADNSLVQQSGDHLDGGDAVSSRSPSMSQPVAATGGGGAVCKSPSPDAKSSTNNDTLPDLIHGNGTQTTTNEQSKACDPLHIHYMAGGEARVSPRNTHAQYSSSTGTTTGKRNARCLEREGLETTTPRPHDGPRRSSRTCWVGKIKADGGSSGAEHPPREESSNDRPQAPPSPSRKNDDGPCGTTMSRPAEAIREAVEAEFVRLEQGGQEKRALMERESAIATARKCWESKITDSCALGTQSRSRRLGNASSKTDRKRGSTHQASPSTVGISSISHTRHASKPLSPRKQSPTPPEHRSASKVGGCGGGLITNATAEGSTGGRRSKDQGRTTRVVSGRVGYFELEQCLQEDGVRLEAVGSSPGPGITLKVYGDVWRWLSDGRVLSLGEKVVEVQFSYVHVDRLAKKATAVAQAFPNLLSLRLLDNDIRFFKQLEYLRPLTTNLATLDLGNNPVVRSASTVALQTWVQAQGARLALAITAHERPNQPLQQSLRSEGSNQVLPPSPSEKVVTLPQGATPKSLAGSFDSPDRLVAQKNAAGSCPPVVMHGNDEREREEDSNRATEAGFVAAREAFARLAEAQERARNTSWGNVALPAGWGWPDRQSRPAASAPTTGVGDAWAASDRAAKLASNSMIRRVCEAHRKDVQFDKAWEAVIRTMVQEVFAVGDPLEETSSPACSDGDHSNFEASSVHCPQTKSPPSVRCPSGARQAFRTRCPPARWLDEC